MFDLAIVGSGFGGSLLAMVARRLGRTVLLLERGSHPRFVIGESSTPMADLLWSELTTRYALPALSPFAHWGTWRRAYPDVGCGLKRGFSFYHHTPGRPFAADPGRSDQLLVGASPNAEMADTHWYRPDFDHFLVGEAIRMGVEYREECEVLEVGLEAGRARLRVREGGRTGEIMAGWVVDAGNRRGPLARSLGLPELAVPHMPATQGLYSHFREVTRLEDLPLHDGMGAAPYPVDDAAVHHVFEGGWIWVLRFASGIVSAGVSATDAVAGRFRFHEGEPAWRRLLDTLPTVARQFEGAAGVRPFVHAGRMTFRTGPAAGPGWALLPSAAGFVDPLLSSGFSLTLLGIERLSRAMEQAWRRPAEWDAAMRCYAEATAADWEVLERYIAALYRRLGDFAAFTEIARLYFTAVVYGETVRRLGRAESAGGFLMREHPGFAGPARACLESALAGTPAGALRGQVDAAIGPFDVGGMSDAARRPWYPVSADDLRAGRGRVGATEEEVEALLRRAGFALCDGA